MSVRVMTAVWDITLADSEKIVLLALADCANDEGWCWPGMKSLARKCSKTDRTVQASIKALCAAGHLTRIEVPGKGCRYQVHPRSDFTPEAASPPKPLRAPPKPVRDTPEAASDKPSKNHKEPSGGRAGARSAVPVESDDHGEADATGSAPAGPRPLPDDWEPPAIGDLQPEARALVQQWPAGAYAAMCANFRNHWTDKGTKNRRKSNWAATLANWLIRVHAEVIRSAKAGVSFAAAAPRATTPAAPAGPVLAKANENDVSASIHARLKDVLGEAIWGQWIRPSALLVDVPGTLVTVTAPSAFHAEWLERHFREQIMAAAKLVIGMAPRAARFEVAAPVAAKTTTEQGEQAHG